ncbi:MAG TPA: ribosome maturation factor RimM [Actinomycetota bacterium]|nr:ribosome maturation factor RimM [Actinomycetota bacterium]
MGRIAKSHGVGGEVSVRPLSEVASRFEPGSVLRLEDDRTLTVERSRPHRDHVLVKFEEVGDRNEADALRGSVLLVNADQAPRIEEADRFWIHQVVGLEVVTEAGRSLGLIREVEGNPANDLWVTEGGALIPAVREVVVGVDLAAGRVTIRELPGLFEEP